MKFKKLFQEELNRYKLLKNYTKNDIMSLLPKNLLKYLSKIKNVKFEIPTNNQILISFPKDNNEDINHIYFKNIKRWKNISDKNNYEYLLTIKTDILKDETKSKKINDDDSLNQDEIIKTLRKKGFHGIVDKLKRKEISLKDAENELTGKSVLYNKIDQDPRKMNPYDIAKIIKKKGIDKQSSYSHYVKFMALKPKLDAKEWFKIYNEI